MGIKFWGTSYLIIDKFSMFDLFFQRHAWQESGCSLFYIISLSGKAGIGRYFKIFPIDSWDLEMELLGKHKRTNRPIKNDAFIEKLERLLERKFKLKTWSQI